MKKPLIIILTLYICLINLSKADEIRDFQIEGMSVGDSLLEYFSESEIKNNLATYYKDNKMSTMMVVSSKFTVYDNVNLSFKTKDKSYRINHISAQLTMNGRECDNKMDEINKDLKTIFKNYKIRKENTKHPLDKTGLSTVKSIYYDFDGGNLAAIQCYDMSEQSNFLSGLKIQLAEKEMIDWLDTKAY